MIFFFFKYFVQVFYYMVTKKKQKRKKYIFMHCRIGRYPIFQGSIAKFVLSLNYFIIRRESFPSIFIYLFINFRVFCHPVSETKTIKIQRLFRSHNRYYFYTNRVGIGDEKGKKMEKKKKRKNHFEGD